MSRDTMSVAQELRFIRTEHAEVTFCGCITAEAEVALRPLPEPRPLLEVLAAVDKEGLTQEFDLYYDWLVPWRNNG